MNILVTYIWPHTQNGHGSTLMAMVMSGSPARLRVHGAAAIARRTRPVLPSAARIRRPASALPALVGCDVL